MTTLLLICFSIYVVGFIIFLIAGLFEAGSLIEGDEDPIGTALSWPVVLILSLLGRNK